MFVVVDQFTKWMELFPLRTATTKTVSQKLEDEVFCRWGTPKVVLSDNGSQFASKGWKLTCKRWGVEPKYISPYHPQANWTERMNRNIKLMIQSYVDEDHTSWDEHLPKFAFALRSAIQESTGHSPAQLNFGRDIAMPIDRILSIAQSNMEEDPDGYVEDLQERLRNYYDKAKTSMEKAQLKQKKYHDAHRREVCYSVGEEVLLRTHPISCKNKKFSAKLAQKWAGPYRIRKRINDLNYELEDDAQESLGVQHVLNLRPYHRLEGLNLQGDDVPPTQEEDVEPSGCVDEPHYNLRLRGTHVANKTGPTKTL